MNGGHLFLPFRFSLIIFEHLREDGLTLLLYFSQIISYDSLIKWSKVLRWILNDFNRKSIKRPERQVRLLNRWNNGKWRVLSFWIWVWRCWKVGNIIFRIRLSTPIHREHWGRRPGASRLRGHERKLRLLLRCCLEFALI